MCRDQKRTAASCIDWLGGVSLRRRIANTALSALVALLAEPLPEIRFTAAHALGNLASSVELKGRIGKAALPEIVALLKDEEPECRSHAAGALRAWLTQPTYVCCRARFSELCW